MKKILLFSFILFCLVQCKKDSNESNHYLWKTKGLIPSFGNEVFLQVKVSEKSPGKYQLIWKPEDLWLFKELEITSFTLHLPQISEARLPIPISKFSNAEPPREFTYYPGWLSESDLAVSFSVNSPLFAVPISSIYNPFGEESFLWLNENKRARKTMVRVLSRKGKDALVWGEIKEGDQIIVNRIWALADQVSIENSR